VNQCELRDLLLHVFPFYLQHYADLLSPVAQALVASAFELKSGRTVR
jgi:hypothetical protein